MALPGQLKTARLDNTSVGSTIDNAMGAFESALADILGFTVDVDITASPFSLNNSGQITKSLVAQKAAGPVGWRLRDSTSGTELRMVVNGTNFDIDENTGSEGSPVWSNRFRMAVATGALTGAEATSSRMGLCPQGDGNSAHYLDGTGAWSTPAAFATIPACRVRASASQSIPSSSLTTITFNTEDWDTDTMHSTVSNTSRITATTTGKYLVTGALLFASNSSGVRALYLYRNGSTVLGQTIENPTSGAAHAQQVSAVMTLTAGDYVELKAYQTSGSTINSSVGATYAPFLAAHKVA